MRKRAIFGGVMLLLAAFEAIVAWQAHGLGGGALAISVGSAGFLAGLAFGSLP